MLAKQLHAQCSYNVKGVQLWRILNLNRLIHIGCREVVDQANLHDVARGLSYPKAPADNSVRLKVTHFKRTI